MNKFIKAGTFRQAKSDLTAPENSGLRFVLNPIDMNASFDHAVNLRLNKKWKKARDDGKGWFANRSNFKLGEIQTVAVQSDVWVVNTLLLDTDKKVNKDGLEKCLKKCADLAIYEKATIHVAQDMLDLTEFKELATKHFLERGLNVYVYASAKAANT